MPNLDEPAQLDLPATGTWREASELGSGEAVTAWAEAARSILIDTAHHYRAVVTHKDLSTQVKHRTGIRTSQQTRHWIGDVLARVASECAERDEPNLSSLCVNAKGSVGPGYAAAVPTGDAVGSGDPDDEAARERLACYRHFDAIGLPADGGVSALTPQVAATRTRTRKAAQAARPIATCPICNMAVPATGVCDECG